jgi:hypothetical protein
MQRLNVYGDGIWIFHVSSIKFYDKKLDIVNAFWNVHCEHYEHYKRCGTEKKRLKFAKQFVFKKT